MRKNMKNISVLLALVLLLTSVCAVSVVAADVNYSVSSATGATGETVTVTVSLSTSVDLWAANVSLGYNSSELQVVSYTAGSATTGGSINDTGSAVNFSGMFTAKSGTVMKVSFKILKESGKSNLALTSSENIDYENNAYEFTTSNGSITINNDISVEKVTLDKTSITLKKGATSKVVATIQPSNTTEKNIGFYSSDDDIVTVDDNGNITAVSGGTATITAYAGNESAKCQVTVTVAQTGIKANGNTSRNAVVGDKINLSVIKVPADTTDNFTAKWTTSNPQVATVASNGTVTAISTGEATITAKVNNWTVTYKIVVAANEDESTTDESTTETTEESTTDESTTNVIVTEPTTPPYSETTTTEEYKLVEPNSNINIDNNDKNNTKEYFYLLVLVAAGVVAVVIGAVTFFVARGYRGKNKKQKIIVEEKFKR